MTSVREIDRLVVSDDAIAARLWPRLGSKVRSAYLGDRDGWVALRRTVEAGAPLPPSTLAAQRKVFAGWARAFRAAAGGRPKRSPAAPASRTPVPFAAAATPPSTDAAASPPPLALQQAAPALAAVAKAKGSAGGAAVAGGLALAGLIAFAARRKRP